MSVEMRASRWLRGAMLAAALLVTPTTAHAAATIFIANFDGPGEGFNDPTPVGSSRRTTAARSPGRTARRASRAAAG